MTIKKAYVEIVDFLRANSSDVVADVLPTVEAMTSAKTGGGAKTATTVHRDEDGNVDYIFCYYHKKWEPIVGEDAVEYGTRLSSATGLSNMCKEGTAAWTKQQRVAKQAKETLLEQLLNGEITSEEAAAMQEDIEEARKQIVPREDGVGYDSLADANG